MKIGIDIDNTILDYSFSFTKHASTLLGASLPEGSTKLQVQNHVVMNYGEDSWTKIQGVVYSQTPLEAIVSEGFKEFLDQARMKRATINFVSHKTQFPIEGPRVNLRKLVLDLLRQERLLNPSLKSKDVVFCDSPEEKLKVIAMSNFNFFIDDLASIISKLPKNLQGLHYRCECTSPLDAQHQPMKNWNQIKSHVFRDFKDE